MKENKVKSQKEIVKIARQLKRKRKKLVAYSGSFDVMHLGHMKSLEEAKSRGDYLVVLLNSDQSVSAYKGPNRPIIPEKERAGMLSALTCVDFIVLFDELAPLKIISRLKPDIYCSGPDWGKNCIERKTVEEYGGKLHVLKRAETLSTSELIDRVLDVYSKTDNQAVFLDRDGAINVNEPEYVHRIKDFRFAPGTIPALQKLSKTDYKIIILTNQSGIGRHYFKESDLKKLHRWMLNSLKRKGVRIDRIYYCPHHPRDNCSCRKPKIGLLLKAARDFELSLNKSWVVGDDPRDVMMAREANVKAIKLGINMPKAMKLEPSFYAKDLLKAANIIYDKKN